MIRYQVLATRKCGLYRREDGKARGETGFVDVPTCRPAEHLEPELAIANLEVKRQVNEIC